MGVILQISYGASSYTLSNKLLYPSFLRTVPTNKDEMDLIVMFIQRFGWNWVAFIGTQGDEYSQNGLDLFRQTIQNTNICLAYLHEFGKTSNYEEVLRKIDSLGINVIVVFTLEDNARDLIKSAIKIKIKGKVWIAGDAWSMDQELSTTPGIEKVGTIFGITQTVLNLPGFRDFVYKSRFTGGAHDFVDDADSSLQDTCNQACQNCTSLSTDEIMNENPTFSFGVYSAVYALAYALHGALSCGEVGCSEDQDIPPYLVSIL